MDEISVSTGMPLPDTTAPSPAAGSTAATSSRSESARTTAVTSRPMLPRAPSTATLSISAFTSLSGKRERVVIERPDDSQAQRDRAPGLGVDPVDVLDGHSFDARDHLFYAEMLTAGQLGLGEPVHAVAAVLVADVERALDVVLGALHLV